MNSLWVENSLAGFAALDGERIEAVDMHSAGEPLRIILHAPSIPPGQDILARRRNAQKGGWDHFRRVLMLEQRGHGDMYGAIIVPPATANADFGVLFMHNEGYSTMCGHGVIALGKSAVDLGWVKAIEPETTVRIDTPAGLVIAHARVRAGRVESTWFENVPSFVVSLNQTVEVPNAGTVCYDLAFGGAFYAFVDAGSLDIRLTADNGRAVASLGMLIKRAVTNAASIQHPDAADLSFLYGTIFTGPSDTEGVHSRHACVFADGAIDRSPTGTGVSARMALLHTRGELPGDAGVRIDSLTGEEFIGRIARQTNLHGKPAVIPIVEGKASFTGRHTFLVEPDDALLNGFLVR